MRLDGWDNCRRYPGKSRARSHSPRESMISILVEQVSLLRTLKNLVGGCLLQRFGVDIQILDRHDPPRLPMAPRWAQDSRGSRTFRRASAQRRGQTAPPGRGVV